MRPYIQAGKRTGFRNPNTPRTMHLLTFNLEDAATYAAKMRDSLRYAHTEAIETGNEFAALAIFAQLSAANDMVNTCNELRDAAQRAMKP